MTRLATALGIEPRDLLPPDRPIAASAAVAAGSVRCRAMTAPPARWFPCAIRSDLIPVRSAARGGDDQEMFLADGPIDYIARPHSLLHVRDAYSIYMIGESMTPRFRPGQLLHVNPYKPPRPGTGVVVTKTDNVVLIKEFVRRSDAMLYLKQYYPAAELEYPLAEIRDIHIVVGLDEP